MARKCTVDDCERPHCALGFCDNHYRLFRRHGNPLGGRTPSGARDAFIERAIAYQGDECLLWPFGRISNDSYGLARNEDGGNSTASRVVCQRVYGPPPSPDHESAHKCKTKLCITPTHLRWATHIDNEADKRMHGTHLQGERQNGAKLTEEQVREIRALQGIESSRVVGDRMNIHRAHIRLIWNRKRWGWLQ